MTWQRGSVKEIHKLQKPVLVEHMNGRNGGLDKNEPDRKKIPDGHRIVERNSREPLMLDAEYKDNG